MMSILFLLLPFYSFQSKQFIKSSIDTRSYDTFTLDNGLDVVIISDPNSM